MGRHEDAGEHGTELFDPAKGFQAGQFGHVHVQQQEVDFLRMDDFESLFAIARGQGMEPARLEDAGQRLPKIGSSSVISSDGQRSSMRG